MTRIRFLGLEEGVRRFDDLGSSRVRDGRGYLLLPLPASSAESEASDSWNAFLALLSYSGVDELHPAQQDAWWVLACESSVQNGGHDAFFEQYPGPGAASTIKALHALGARVHADVLTTAAARIAAGEASGDGPYGLEDLDAAFAAASPGLVETLEQYFRARRSDFVRATSAER
jgi:hypothetical protein